ncbi:tetratricopeptide repeat protein [Lederbergia wuyishanensis]|uniref:Tetratricopeptide (TPR) repeat protein n=1 Tax=Lederbergia wuyishanensis TaxID=1347903 RepID=A0ABU0D622_9BACI|nr:tetratricopeptide repeat protein [Lederbergia wuyishanensis]MCJ8008718.1 tetratricopeptide repeat protein [Lederbergia wuyishanensis]MDQ0343862.1 tetratricopeptide (TPR) repeat protein [Lederbergia wuyishanensis]
MKQLEEAIELRNSGSHLEANELLVRLAEKFSTNADVQYHCAWSFDVLGKEAEAVPYYELALKLGLNDSDAKGAFLGLGSTYRTLGEYEKAGRVLEEGINRYPDFLALRVFQAMTLYNVKNYEKAMEMMLLTLTQTSSDESIQSYRKAIEFYAKNLNETWK